MSKLIEKLALEAEFSIKDVYHQGDNFQKFAELIVAECIEIGDELTDHYINNHNEQAQAFLLAAVADYVSQIKQRFGVRE